jgi:hypothetical protein
MIRIFKIALRNLMRYKRRTLLTAMLITLGKKAIKRSKKYSRRILMLRLMHQE